ncbi:hypothetical protein CEN49_26960, partial [Fischerella thermalis CCMEE 5273]
KGTQARRTRMYPIPRVPPDSWSGKRKTLRTEPFLFAAWNHLGTVIPNLWINALFHGSLVRR